MPALRADGTEVQIELAISVVPSAGPRTWIAVARDITERKRAEAARLQNQAIEEQNRRILEANRLKSEFLANMSHELRTPLNAIIGFADLMHSGKAGPLSAEHEEYLGDILTSSRHLLQLINDVLDLAKVESGKMEFRPEPVDLAGAGRGRARQSCAASRAASGSASTSQVDPRRVRGHRRSRALKQILYNYLSNAIKFTPEADACRSGSRPRAATPFRIEVEDTGIGIRTEDLGRLFVEFQQLDAGIAKRYPGTGLGLALTKRLVEAQGGRVDVRSAPVRAARFRPFFRARRRNGRSPPAGRSAPPRRAIARCSSSKTTLARWSSRSCCWPSADTIRLARVRRGKGCGQRSRTRRPGDRRPADAGRQRAGIRRASPRASRAGATCRLSSGP